VEPPVTVDMKISVLCSSVSHPVHPYLENWAKATRAGHEIELLTEKADLSGGDVLFLISCHEIISDRDRQKYGLTLVIHSSDLPEGRGWSPQVWQVLEGKNEIVVSVIEAAEKVDTGHVWAKRRFALEGHELYDEINEKLFAVWLDLMSYVIENAGSSTSEPQDSRAPTYYRRRTIADSRLDPDKSIAEQFDLLRVADPNRFPAFIDIRGHRYFVRISKDAGDPDG
jgi:methionyl-tRNA formyltransferase